MIRGTQRSVEEWPRPVAVWDRGRWFPEVRRAVVVAAAVLILVGPWAFAGEEPSRVLVIESERPDRPLWIEFSTAFKSALLDSSERPVDVFFENLDSARLGGDVYLDRTAEWLIEKYRSIRPDVIVTSGPETYRLIARRFDLVTTGTSLVCVAIDQENFQNVGRLPRSTALLRDFGMPATVRLALELLPGTRRLAIVGGPKDPRSYSHFFYSQIVAAFADNYEIIDLSGLPMAEIRARAARLPEDTVLVLTAMTVDGDGQPFTHPEVAAEISPGANAPLFGSIKTELGYGTVGGDLYDPAMSGRETAALVARILDGEPAESIEPTLVDTSADAFDWRQLERWGIPERRLPPGSVVEFKPQTLWEEHPRAVLLTLVIFLAQGGSIAALLIERARRRRINRELRELSSRLITAQEEERRRVARELHDDVSQRLALLAIDLELPGATERIGDTVAKVHGLARDVHVIAQHLQPPRLEGGGLARELRAFCAEVSSRHGLQVDCRVPEGAVDLDADTALALYRVAQEAVQNAVKHSGADEVAVELGVSLRWASVTVSDNGRGFDVGSIKRRRALGIAGMTERLRLAGGWLNIDSVPHEGTIVSAWMPLESQREGGAA